NHHTLIPRDGQALTRSDHRKMIEVDNEVAYVGGMNFSKGFDQWHDLMVRAEGPVAAQGRAEFLGRWNDLGGKTRPPTAPLRSAGNGEARLVANSPGGDLDNTKQYIDGINAAKQRAWVITPQIGSAKLVQPLIAAAGRGVDVRLLLPSHQAKGLAPYVTGLTSQMFYRDLVKAGVKVYEIPEMTHSKGWIVDQSATVGSFN